jgi:hypothetical protein
MQVHPGKAPRFVWWVIWLAILTGLVVLRFVVPEPAGADLPPGPAVYAGLVPLVVSALLRWWVLPRTAGAAESCGLLGLFLGGDQRDTFLVLAVIGIAQWVPFFPPDLSDAGGGRAHGLRTP